MDVQDHADVSASEAKGKAPRARRPRAAKPAPDAAGKRSLNLRIDNDAYIRLSIHATMKGTTISDLVMGFAQGLREYSMPHRIGGRAEVETS